MLRSYTAREGADAEAASKAAARRDKAMAVLADALDGHEYLVDDRFSIADVVTGGVLDSARTYDLMPEIPVLPRTSSASTRARRSSGHTHPEPRARHRRAFELGESPVWDARARASISSTSRAATSTGSTRSARELSTSRRRRNGRHRRADDRGAPAPRSGHAAHARRIGSREISDVDGVRFNDGVVDASGRFWIGTMALDESPGGRNAVPVRRGRHGADARARLDLERDRLDARRHTDVLRRQHGAADRRLRLRRHGGDDLRSPHVRRVDPVDGTPTGSRSTPEAMCGSRSGTAGRCGATGPTGRSSASSTSPCPNVTGCAFGGDDLGDLYVTSARKGLSAAELRAQPDAGGLFVSGPASPDAPPTWLASEHEPRRPEVRRHLGRRPRARSSASRAASSRRPRAGTRRLRGRLGDGAHDRRADRARRAGLAEPAPARAGHAAHRGRADLDGARLDGDQRPRPRGDLAHRLPGGDRHRHDATARRASSRCARGRVHEALDEREDRDRRRLPGRVADDATSRRSAAAARTRPPSRSPPRSAPTSARSTPTSTASTAPIRGSSPSAHKLHEVSYEEMLDLAASGARVLALRSVEYARNHGVKIHVRSSFNDSEGTWIVKEEDMLEQAIISGIAHDTSEAKVTIRRVPDRPGVAGRTFRPLADAGINIDRSSRTPRSTGLADISFTLPENELDRAEPILERLVDARSAPRASPPSATSRRSRSSAPGCARTPASPPRSSRRSRTPASTSRSSRRPRSASRASSRRPSATAP